MNGISRAVMVATVMFVLLGPLSLSASGQIILFSEDFEDNLNRNFTTVARFRLTPNTFA